MTSLRFVTTNISIEKEIANNAEKALENIKNKISQWGDTEFSVEEIEIFFDNRQQTTDNRLCPQESHVDTDGRTSTAYFIRASVLGEMKKDLVEKLKSYLIEKHRDERERRDVTPVASQDVTPVASQVIYPQTSLSYLGNVINKKAREFYELHGVTDIEDGLEKLKSNDELVVMTTKHCIRYANNICSKEIGKPATSLYLVNDKGRYRLDFDCRNCCMKVIKEKFI